MSHDSWQDDEVFRDHFAAGIYVCANCENKLFASGSKFAHKSPWPSFSNTIHTDSVKKVPEPNRPKALRVYCGQCETRLGHEFLGEGPKGTSRF
ncbi:hypothetical protein MTO96_006523 [Rhipicephalus appendiculatus]|uniref:peptide-methionine (R)-S-oxide reductase n=1 Tax=Rhipicephalus appendiculatus TaxID=34631 RepID=A0A131YNN0_RHIAP